MEKTNKNVVAWGPRPTDRTNEKTAFQTFLEDLRLEQMELR